MTMPVLWSMDNLVCDAYEALDSISSGLHGHHHFLLTVITRGRGIQTLNGKDIQFCPNDLFLLSPSDFHRNTVAPGESFDYFGVKFSYELLDERLSDLCVMERFPIHIHLSDSTAKIIRFIFTQLVDESRHGQNRLANRAYQQALVEQLFILALREMPQDNAVRPSTFINRALGYIYSHFYEPITVSDAASYVGYTPNYFNTRFRELLNVPFGEYLRQLRLTYAENLLLASNTSVTEIALEAGFASLSHFSHCFCVKYGVSPQQYRKTTWRCSDLQSEQSPQKNRKDDN